MKNSLFRYVCLVVALLICSFADAQHKNDGYLESNE